ncbi:meiotic nuclear divisions 1-like protein [Rhodotorula toruloides]|uniref:Meiotic nuclear divisions 1-like protein n=1 Tax=Rhodotorula toruloides TaxID=5286 RepID=A0A511KEK3_RHOTO|nr:meiotic nuclear divisions 1-like protein [Rhodotorula toruloides]
MSKKGLSLEEKRTRMLELFRESKEFYKLQELEKAWLPRSARRHRLLTRSVWQLAPKTKGITSMSVKEVLQSLVDDSLVKFEKIGSMVSFLSLKKRKQLSNLEQSVKTLKRQHQDLTLDIAERAALIERYEDLQARHIELEKQLDSFTTPDEVKLAEAKQELIERLKTSALRSTDNISAFLSYQRNNGGSEAAAAFRQEQGLPEDFDDLSL